MTNKDYLAGNIKNPCQSKFDQSFRKLMNKLPTLKKTCYNNRYHLFDIFDLLNSNIRHLANHTGHLHQMLSFFTKTYNWMIS